MNTKWKVEYIKDDQELRVIFLFAENQTEAFERCRDCVRRCTPIRATDTREVPLTRMPSRAELDAMFHIEEQSELPI